VATIEKINSIAPSVLDNVNFNQNSKELTTVNFQYRKSNDNKILNDFLASSAVLTEEINNILRLQFKDDCNIFKKIKTLAEAIKQYLSELGLIINLCKNSSIETDFYIQFTKLGERIYESFLIIYFHFILKS
jgi:hypothetical protein